MTDTITIVIIIHVTIGERLRAWRVERGLSQKDAASLAGFTQGAWCQYENDEVLPRVQQAVAIAKLTEGDANEVTVEMVAEAEKARDVSRRERRSGTDG